MLENTKRRNVKDFYVCLNALACQQFYIACVVAISEADSHFFQHLIYWILCSLTIVKSLKAVKRKKENTFSFVSGFFLSIFKILACYFILVIQLKKENRN